MLIDESHIFVRGSAVSISFSRRRPCDTVMFSSIEPNQKGLKLEFGDRWTGGYIFENEWQSFRTRKNRDLELTTAPHKYEKPGRYTVAVKVVDIFGNDTMTLVPVNVG